MTRYVRYTILSLSCFVTLFNAPARAIEIPKIVFVGAAKYILEKADKVLKQIPDTERAQKEPVDPLLNRLNEMSGEPMSVAKKLVYPDTFLGTIRVRMELLRLKGVLSKLPSDAPLSREETLKKFEKWRQCANALIEIQANEQDKESIVAYFSAYPEVKQRIQSLFQAAPPKIDDTLYWMTRPGNPEKAVQFIDRMEKEILKVSMELMPKIRGQWEKEKQALEQEQKEVEKKIPESNRWYNDIDARYQAQMKKEGSTSQSAEIKRIQAEHTKAATLRFELQSKQKKVKEDLAQLENNFKEIKGQGPSWCDTHIGK